MCIYTKYIIYIYRYGKTKEEEDIWAINKAREREDIYGIWGIW